VLKVSEEVEGTAGVGLDMRLLFEETAWQLSHHWGFSDVSVHISLWGRLCPLTEEIAKVIGFEWEKSRFLSRTAGGENAEDSDTVSFVRGLGLFGKERKCNGDA
jgi:hypothetical protein